MLTPARHQTVRKLRRFYLSNPGRMDIFRSEAGLTKKLYSRLCGGGGGRAWFSRAIVFAIRNKLDWTLDRIPLKYPGRGWANPADVERNGSLCATTSMGPSRENQTLIRWETRATRESCLGIVHLQPPQPRAERFSRDGRRRQWLWLTPGLDWNQTRRKK